MLVQAFRFRGLVINRQPRISVLFEVKAYKAKRIVDFLVDTGTTYSAITEKDVAIMKIDYSALPYYKRRAVGFGGFFQNRMINRQIILTFKSKEDEYKITLGSIQVIGVPSTITGEEREKLIRYIPNVLGMDILRRFRTCVDKNYVELIVKK